MQKILCFYEFMVILKMENFFQTSKKSIFMNMHLWLLNILTFQMIFDILKLTKSWKFIKIGRFWIKQGRFTQNFAKQPNIFWFPKFLGLFFTPRNTPPKVKNSKPDKSTILFGTPCRLYSTQWCNNLPFIFIILSHLINLYTNI